MELLRLVIRMENLDKLNINIKEIASQKLKTIIWREYRAEYYG